MYALQSILDIAQICSQRNIGQAVLCPGSRSAPLTVAFSQHPNFETLSIVDERSAAFVALGLAQSSQKTVVLVCTSGTAGLNFSPAVAEAFYAQTPLLVLTADRPPEWIDQLDGQTIRQNELFGKHVKASFSLPVDYSPDSIWHIQRIVNEAISLANEFPKAPVHINCPFREPFYPPKNHEISYGKPRIFETILAQKTLSETTFQELAKKLNEAQKVIIVGGQHPLDKKLGEILEKTPFVVVSDIISNLHTVPKSIRHQDKSLTPKNQALLGNADILITFGKSLISKNLKVFLRNFRPAQHWHIQEAGTPADTFQALNKHIPVSPLYFFEIIQKYLLFSEEKAQYEALWQKIDASFEINKQSFSVFSEAQVVWETLRNLPKNTVLHLANSMAVRYANVFNLEDESIEVFANRGTSGIDGSTSTALGHALNSDKMHVLITGDLAFFYDQNAFWNKYLPKNFRVLLLNNGGGGIFDVIDQPKNVPSALPYFLTEHRQNAAFLAQNYDLNYWKVQNKSDLESYLPIFLEKSEKSAILEVFTDITTNTEVWKKLGN